MHQITTKSKCEQENQNPNKQKSHQPNKKKKYSYCIKILRSQNVSKQTKKKKSHQPDQKLITSKYYQKSQYFFPTFLVVPIFKTNKPKSANGHPLNYFFLKKNLKLGVVLAYFLSILICIDLIPIVRSSNKSTPNVCPSSIKLTTSPAKFHTWTNVNKYKTNTASQIKKPIRWT